MKGLFLASLTIAGLVASVPASALPVDAFYYAGPGLGLSIPDNDPTGVSSTISVPDDMSIEKIALIVLVDHTWVGDLIFTLTGPDGQTITLVDRPGYPAAPAGDDADLSTEHPIIIGDYSPLEAELMGAGGCTEGGSVVGLDCPRWFNSDTSLAGTWGGSSALGDWTLSITDNAGQDVGVLDGWLIAFGYGNVAVPLPAGVWLVASGLVALAARRRRQ
jgi:subtilisin-like proprotein convertase family protein